MAIKLGDSWKLEERSDMKVCFVTTGATAPFTGLIESVLTPSTIEALQDVGYTHLLVQYGTAKEVFDNQSSAALKRLGSKNPKQDFVIGGIDFSPEALKFEFQLVQKSKGLVISHAGSGTILEALRYQVPLIVVPNTALLDNHQEELAVAMERSNYLIRGDVK
jgi:beta-1,4-N-acetylglucosaminyltransferase